MPTDTTTHNLNRLESQSQLNILQDDSLDNENLSSSIYQKQKILDKKAQDVLETIKSDETKMG